MICKECEKEDDTCDAGFNSEQKLCAYCVDYLEGKLQDIEAEKARIKRKLGFKDNEGVY